MLTITESAEPLTKVTAYLTDRQLDRLKRESAVTGASVSWLLRKSVDALLPAPESEAR